MATDDVTTHAVVTVKEVLALAGEEAALHRGKPWGVSANRNSRATGRQDPEAAAAVGTASKAHGRPGRNRESGRPGRPERKRSGPEADRDRGAER
ncbi:MAG: hypothetical protein ACRDOK_10715 [Streptosporangiaceae bacterium]